MTPFSITMLILAGIGIIGILLAYLADKKTKKTKGHL